MQHQRYHQYQRYICGLKLSNVRRSLDSRRSGLHKYQRCGCQSVLGVTVASAAVAVGEERTVWVPAKKARDSTKARSPSGLALSAAPRATRPSAVASWYSLPNRLCTSRCSAPPWWIRSFGNVIYTALLPGVNTLSQVASQQQVGCSLLLDAVLYNDRCGIRS